MKENKNSCKREQKKTTFFGAAQLRQVDVWETKTRNKKKNAFNQNGGALNHTRIPNFYQ